MTKIVDWGVKSLCKNAKSDIAEDCSALVKACEFSITYLHYMTTNVLIFTKALFIAMPDFNSLHLKRYK